ncbi:uncharacterized protein C1orf112-like [Schistocerca serialis cubense]|uniref:uncharacterized protein C1orf112-like n=1 Tax=Schistocerca serialis cubense TaxID=2023355 RepID=UPI00214F19D9|nr:uncharacterized protein C1orf112-like [Schistocerca serialis cubense]
MNSEESVTDLLAKIKEWTVDEVKEKIDEVVPVLVISLECSEKSVTLQAVQVLLGSCLQCLSVNNAENVLLQYALPTVRHIFAEALEGVQLILASSEDGDQLVDSLVSLLQVCIEMLKCLEITLQYIISQGNVDAFVVPSVPRMVIAVLQESFKHCQKSESTYGSVLHLISEVLMELFNKSHEVLLNFLAVLSENLQFNCIFEDEVTLLTEVLESFGYLCEHMKGLGVKVLADSWKGYILLVEKYSKDLKPYLNVTAPIKFLVQEIAEFSDSVMNVQNEYDKPDIIKNLKVTSFELKLILKLCESYAGYLSDSYTDLFHLLITLHRLSPHFLLWKKVPTGITEEIERYLSIGADPLLSHLLEDRCFVQEFFVQIETVSEDADLPGFIGLSVGIMKKLTHCEHSTRTLWLSEDSGNNLLRVIFSKLETCHSVLSSAIRIPATVPNGELPKLLDVYETILIHIAAVIVTTPVSEFASVETLLFENIFKHDFWRALLAGDVWCIVARYGSPDLCLHHLMLLVDMLKLLDWSSGYRPEVVQIMSLIKRLYPLLPEKHKAQMIQSYPLPENIVLWCVLQPSSAVTDASTMDVAKETMQLIEEFKQGSLSSDKYKKMLYLLSAAPHLLDDQISKSSNIPLIIKMTELWKCTTSLDDDDKMNNTKSFSIMKLLKALVIATSKLIVNANNAHVLLILNGLKEVAEKGSSAMKLQILPVLRALASKTLDCDVNQPKVCFDIGVLFGTLMQDESSIVRQASLDVFAYFAYVTKHEQIVINSVSRSNVLQSHVAMFLKKQFAKVNKLNAKDINEYLNSQKNVQFCHKCKKTELFEDVAEEKTEQKAKKPKIDQCSQNVSEVLDRIEADTALIVNMLDEDSLPEIARTKVVSIMAQLEGLL